MCVTTIFVLQPKNVVGTENYHIYMQYTIYTIYPFIKLLYYYITIVRSNISFLSMHDSDIFRGPVVLSTSVSSC